MKGKMTGGGVEQSCLKFVFTEKEVHNYQIVLRFKNWWRVDGESYLVFPNLYSLHHNQLKISTIVSNAYLFLFQKKNLFMNTEF